MTDTIITLPIAAEFSRVPAKGLTQTESWISSAGLGFGALLAAYSRAIDLAYSAPFQTPSHGRKHGPDEDLEGRDPNW
jgi:predicted oxidoreductase (fatty acid repression mutant protein)